MSNWKIIEKLCVASVVCGTLITQGAEPPATAQPQEGESSARLGSEVRGQGWIVYSGKTEKGDWDLYVMRPDGSERHHFTDTRDFNEAGARFSPDLSRVLYYRTPKAEEPRNNVYGTFDLVLAKADGSEPVVYGNAFPWATWSPDGRQLACLTLKGIQIVDVATRQVVRQLPRKGIANQMAWSPDGKSFLGTTDGLGPYWTIGCMNTETGAIRPISEVDRYNCTADWVADARRVVYARGIIPERGGRAELWVATLDGQKPQPLYAEEGRHIYGACASPDMQYLLFTRSIDDLDKIDHAHTTMAIIRWADTPMVGDESAALRQRLPQARRGPRLDLGPGWEPHWTLADLRADRRLNTP
jgi:dipeptidyl aminopeptidase/acylaminoacyl peptidase